MKSEINHSKSSFNISEIQYYENAKNTFQKAFVCLQSNCSLCATNLEITVSRQDTGEIKEEAFCPQCALRLRSKLHTLN